MECGELLLTNLIFSGALKSLRARHAGDYVLYDRSRYLPASYATSVKFDVVQNKPSVRERSIQDLQPNLRKRAVSQRRI